MLYQKLYRSIFLMVLTIANLQAHTQGANKSQQKLNITTEIRPVSIGEVVPDIKLKKFLHFPDSSIYISAFRGKALLIDFWETSCVNCIKALPKIQALQEKYSDKLQVITVTRFSTKEELLKILGLFKVFKNYKLPTIYQDDQLYKYFPFQLISHVIWIGPDGVVKAKTGTQYITEGNIKKIISGETLELPVKNDVLSINYKAPLFSITNKEITKPKTTHFSSFSGYIDGIDSRNLILEDSSNRIITINYFNVGLLDLCKGVIKGEVTGDYDLKEVVLNVGDPERFRDYNFYSVDSLEIQKYKENSYCYSASFPWKNSREEIQTMFKEDLKKWINLTLNIEVKKEKRMIKCLLIRFVNSNTTIGDLIRESQLNTVKYRKTILAADSIPLKYLRIYLNGIDELPYVIDETGISNNDSLDITIDKSLLNDIAALKSALHKYGIDLVEGFREREMYVITEKGFEGKKE